MKIALHGSNTAGGIYRRNTEFSKYLKTDPNLELIIINTGNYNQIRKYPRINEYTIDTSYLNSFKSPYANIKDSDDARKRFSKLTKSMT